LGTGGDLKIVTEKRPSPCFSIVRSKNRGSWVNPAGVDLIAAVQEEIRRGRQD
jgi:hypothetical protein